MSVKGQGFKSVSAGKRDGEGRIRDKAEERKEKNEIAEEKEDSLSKGKKSSCRGGDKEGRG